MQRYVPSIVHTCKGTTYSAKWPAARAQSSSSACGKHIEENAKTEDVLSWAREL